MIKTPLGNTSVLDDPTQASTSFIPDVTGEYVLNLIVDDGVYPSEASSMTVLVVDQNTAITALLQDTLSIINGLEPDDFLKKNSGNKLTKKISTALRRLDRQKYEEALKSGR